ARRPHRRRPAIRVRRQRLRGGARDAGVPAAAARIRAARDRQREQPARLVRRDDGSAEPPVPVLRAQLRFGQGGAEHAHRPVREGAARDARQRRGTGRDRDGPARPERRRVPDAGGGRREHRADGDDRHRRAYRHVHPRGAETALVDVSPGRRLVRRAAESPLPWRLTMQYALMVYAEPGYEQAYTDAERAAALAEYAALADDPRCLDAAQLQPAETATTVRVAGGRTLMTDGPFADTKEVLGGFCLIEA